MGVCRSGEGIDLARGWATRASQRYRYGVKSRRHWGGPDRGALGGWTRSQPQILEGGEKSGWAGEGLPAGRRRILRSPACLRLVARAFLRRRIIQLATCRQRGKARMRVAAAACDNIEMKDGGRHGMSGGRDAQINVRKEPPREIGVTKRGEREKAAQIRGPYVSSRRRFYSDTK